MAFRSVVKKIIPSGLFRSIEPYGHLLEAVLVQVRYGFPAKNLNIIGVTGTDGKTTTSMLIAKMLESSGKKVGLITTAAVNYADGEGNQPSPTHMTTASAATLATMLKKIAANNPDWVVLETSSHALAQNRVWGIPYSIAVFTNLSHEHLDYHKTFANYRAAKVKLFKLANKNKKGLQTGVVNADDTNASYFAEAIKNSVTYGVKAGDMRAANIQTNASGNTFTATDNTETYTIKSQLPGDFNVLNCLAAVCVGKAVGLNKTDIEQGIAALGEVPGRMMRINAGQPFEVIIDYAVTPAALENVLGAVRKVTKGKVSLVFGATGDRDKSKRGPMGEVAAKLADKIYLTDDETYTEDPDKIRRAVARGIEKAGGKYQEFSDRKSAIQNAIAHAEAGDCVLITGIGHQTTRNMGGHDEPWSDIETTKSLLKNIK